MNTSMAFIVGRFVALIAVFVSAYKQDAPSMLIALALMLLFVGLGHIL